MPAIIPLVAMIVFFITIFLKLIHFILQNEGVVLSAICFKFNCYYRYPDDSDYCL